MGDKAKVIEKILKKHLEYDHSDPSPCRHCGKDTVTPTYWFDHVSTIARNTAEGLGFYGVGINVMIGDIIREYASCTGSPTKDARAIAPLIACALYGEGD